MTNRRILATGAAAAFLLAGLTAYSEALNGLRMAYFWFGLAMAVAVVALALPDDRPAR